MRNLTGAERILALALSSVFSLSGCGPGEGDAGAGEFVLAGVPGLPVPKLLEDTSVVVRRVHEGPALGWSSTPSPDGRYITIGGDAGSLGRLDLVTGETLPIKDKGTWSEAAEWAETNAFSPDGSRVAFVYGTSSGYEIRISDVDGSNERVLIGADPPFYAVLGPWRGNEILASFYRNETAGYEVVGISPEDASIRSIRAFGSNWRQKRVESPLTLSPDGRFFTYGERSPDGDADVVIARTRDGTESGRIVGHANDLAVAWTPDGSALLFYSDRQLTEGVWRVRMEDGRATGEAVLVRGDLWNFEAIGQSGDAFFFSLKTDVPRVRVAAFDPGTGALLSEPSAVSEVSVGHTVHPIWSPDGTAMAYVKPGPEDYDGLEQHFLVVRSLSGPDAREIALDGMSVRGLQAWTSSGKIIGTGKRAADGNFYTWAVDLESGEIETLVGETDLRGPIPRAVSPDGTTGYYGKDGNLVALDLASRRERVVASFEGNRRERGPYVSPDGESVAVILSDQGRNHTILAVVPAAGGSLKELFRQRAPAGLSQTVGVIWAPDQQHLFFSTHGVDSVREPARLWKADYMGSDPAVTEVEDADELVLSRGAVVSPDGRRIAFVAGRERGETWMMTNLAGGGR